MTHPPPPTVGIAPRDPIDMTTEEDDGADCEEDAPTATTAAGGESATDNYSSLQCKCGARGPNRCVCSQEVSPATPYFSSLVCFRHTRTITYCM